MTVYRSYLTAKRSKERNPFKMEESVKNPYLLQSVSNALSIIELLGQHEELSALEVSQLMGIGKATAFRLLYTLEQHNFVAKSSYAKYRLSIKLASLGEVVTRRMEITRIVHPYLEKLSHQFHETAHLVVWNSQTDVIVADRVIGSSPISYKTVTGFITPAHSAASGRVLLAYAEPEKIEAYLQEADFIQHNGLGLKNGAELRNLIQEIHSSGMAENEGDAILGLSAYAVPIFDNQGIAIASISVSGAQASLNAQKKQIISALKSCAQEINDLISL